MPSNAATDITAIQEIAQRFAQGDPHALAEILQVLGPLVSRRLLHLLGTDLSHEDREDILSVALTQLWRYRERYDPARPLLPWFYLIARNAAFDWLRRQHQLPGKVQQLPVEVVNPPPHYQQREQHASTSSLGRLDCRSHSLHSRNEYPKTERG